MKKLLAATAVLMMVNSFSAQASVIDVAAIKCKELLAMSPEEISYIFIWVHGYYGGKAGDTTIDLASMDSAGKAIGAKCAANQSLGLLTAIEQMMH